MVSEIQPRAAPKRRQAVIVIHGIGEQRPMNTLRAFVTSVLKLAPGASTNTDTEPAYYSKPDTFSDSFELRQLTTTYSRLRTDFFEFYWAHRMPVAPWSRIFEWLWLLVSRPRASMPTKFRGLWILSRIILTLIAFGALASILLFFFPSLRPASYSGTAI